ncbi:PQQ-binding-like beta-propeller repeat protein [Iodobacter sp. HSC-16F04]|uniref:PQQ-binding-like beta-propeller repeat protein n=1 Tax=Iodobacter violaceini TaxID=3044271 RepID=A0ABX0KMU4_9NEIS|nr:PilC/PilY family type IV pilus protein [Iodobacter violacea]NHQ85721.1 PQQ-binding-like beta-propeller repeat protein [Iodobacter violacea]
MKIIALSILSISLNSWAAQTADKPLSTLSVGDIKPNVMFIIDDSGSMAWSFMPDSVINWRNNVGYHNAYCNGVYYNPKTTYLAPKNANGTDMPNASFTAAWYDGFSSGSTRTYNLSNGFFAYDNTGSANNGNSRQEAAFYWNYKPAPATMPSDSQCAQSLTRPGSDWEKVVIPQDNSAKSAAERQNFANWFSYYRTRILMMKSSAGAAFSSIGDRYRVGFSSINNLTSGYYSNDRYLNIDNYASSQKAAWYAMLYGTYPGGGTPLKSALNAVGRIYSGQLPSGNVTDPMQYTCQQNFTILTTDGYWNRGNNAGIGKQDNASNIPYPMRDDTNTSETLADVAMYYFKNDNRPNMANNVPGVEAFADGAKGRQLMRTYTLGLGMDGQLKRSDYEPLTNKRVPWPQVVGDTLTTIDDLWHAAVNGGGEYFSAKDPNAVAAGISKALSDIEAKTASVGSSDVSSSFMSEGDNSIYSSSFKTISWTGDVQARTLNLETSALEAVTWSANSKLGVLGHANRKIYTCTPGACTTLTDFNDQNSALRSAMAAGVNALKTSNGTLNSAQLNQNTASALINYLRGDKSNEIKPDAKDPNSLYRVRTGFLGSVIHGGVSYVKKPNKAYSDAGYADFVRNNTNRKAMVYAPANDGMLHAFDAVTGDEKWAFVPPTVIPRLWQQAERAYTNDFKYFVDGAPTIADIKVGNAWKTILIGGLRGGGGEYYALDITNPTTPVLLWSFSDTRLGNTYGFPVVGKVNNTWKVLLSSGYDNADNKGYIFALNAATGVLDNTFTSSCSNNTGLCGLSKIGVLFENRNVDDTILMAYAGDLAGNLWRFNPKDGSGALVAKTGFDQAPQAITTAPVVKATEYKNTSNEAMHYVTFGTGRYLNQADIANSDTHTFYGLLVDPSASIIDPAFTALRSSAALNELQFEKNGNDIQLTRKGDSRALDTPAALLECNKRTRGWRANMFINKERLANDPLPRGEKARFFTSVPGGDACEAGGISREYLLPMEISSNWMCANPKFDRSINTGSDVNGIMLDDQKQIPSVITEKDDSLDIKPDGTPEHGKALLRPDLRGRRSAWTEIVN